MTVSQEGSVPIEEPYYPNILEKIRHAFGLHCWTIWYEYADTVQRRECVICKKLQARHL